MAFEKFYQESNERSKKVEMVKIVPINNPLVNQTILLKSIYDIPQMNDTQLRNFVDTYYESIINAVYDGSNKYAALDNLSCFINTRFLDALIDVLPKKQLGRDMIIKCNQICYDYISYPGHVQNITSRMVRLGNIINSRELPRLLGLGIRHDVASYILMARYSSFDLSRCVKNVNYVIISRPKEEMTYQTILEIFRILYNDMIDRDIWPRIFQYFMLDVIPERNEQDPNTHWITSDVEEINSTINLVILEILNEIPSEKIRSALLNYSSLYYMLNKGMSVRFTMQRLSNDFSNINRVIAIMRDEEYISIP